MVFRMEKNLSLWFTVQWNVGASCSIVTVIFFSPLFNHTIYILTNILGLVIYTMRLEICEIGEWEINSS